MKRRFLRSWIAAVLAATLALLAHLSLRFENVRLGYEVSAARKEQAELQERKRLLMVETASLRQASRIESVAREQLGMVTPKESEIMAMDVAASNAPIAGEIR